MQQPEKTTTSSSHQRLAAIGLLDCLHVIARRSKTIMLATLAGGVMTAVYSLTLPNVYSAKAMILPAQEDKGLMSMMSQLGGLAGLAGGSVGGPTTVDLYVTMLRSETIMDLVIDRFRLMEVFGVKYRVDAYDRLNGEVAISTGKKDGVITVAVEDKDPQRAAELANAYVEELGRLTNRFNVFSAGQNRIFLEERLAKAKGDLAKAEENLKAFQSKNKAVQMTAQAEATIRGIAEMRAQLAGKEVQLATYKRQFTDSSQEVKNLTASIANLKLQIVKLEGGGGNGAIPPVGAVPALGQEYARIVRDFKIQESLVETLTKQYEMTKFSEAKDISPFQVIQQAKVPERKSKPSRSKMVLIGTFIVLLLSVLVSFVREYSYKIPDHDRERFREIKRELLFWKREL